MTAREILCPARKNSNHHETLRPTARYLAPGVLDLEPNKRLGIGSLARFVRIEPAQGAS